MLKYNYAFVDFEEHGAAEKAVKEMNEKTFVNGEELVVEQSGRRKKSIYDGNLNYDCSARREKEKERERWGKKTMIMLKKRMMIMTWHMY